MKRSDPLGAAGPGRADAVAQVADLAVDPAADRLAEDLAEGRHKEVPVLADHVLRALAFWKTSSVRRRDKGDQEADAVNAMMATLA